VRANKSSSVIYVKTNFSLTWSLEAKIMGSEKGSRDPHAEATAESASFHGNEYASNKGRNVGNDILCAVRAEAI
jgi:hypothetical protein